MQFVEKPFFFYYVMYLEVEINCLYCAVANQKLIKLNKNNN